MDINDCAKERVIYDEDWYYGAQADEMAVNDLMERDGLTEEEVREEYTDSQIFEHVLDMREFDYGFEMDDLARFFAGEKGEGFSFENPDGGNRILARGSVGRWDGTTSGIAVYKDFKSATDCSASRFGLGNVFADCEIDKVWDVNGHLFVSGHHHDGRVEVELKQLTGAGERLYEENTDWGDLYFPEEGVRAMGSTYRDGDEGRFVADLFENPEMCAAPRFMERCFGTDALAYAHEDLGLAARPLAKDAPERHCGYSYAVQMAANDIPVGSEYLVKDLAEAKAYCENFAKRYWGDAAAPTLAAESRDMQAAKSSLAGGRDEALPLPGKASPENR